MEGYSTMPSVLVVGTTKWPDHFEIGVEIALRHSAKNWNVTYIFLESAHDPFYLENYWTKSLRSSKIGKYLLDDTYYQKTLIEAKKISDRIEFGNFDFSFVKAKEWKKKINLNIKQIKNIEDLRKLNYKNFSVGQYIATSLIYLRAHSNPPLNKFRFELENLTSDTFNLIDYFCKFISQNSYERAVIFNGRFHNSGPIYEVAKSFNLQTYFHEKGGFDRSAYFFESWRPQSEKNRGKLARRQWESLEKYDKIAAVNKSVKGLKFAREDSGFSWKTFASASSDINDSILENTKSTKSNNVCFFTSSEDEFENLSETMLRSSFPSQTESIKMLSQVCEKMNLNLTVRVHPNLSYKHSAEMERWDNRLSGLLGPAVKVIGSSSKVNSYDLALSSTINCVWNSTIAIESVYMGKPTLTFCDSFAEYSGCDVLRVHDKRDIEEKLLLALAYEVKKESALPAAFFLIQNGHRFNFLLPTILKLPGVSQPIISKLFIKSLNTIRKYSIILVKIISKLT